MTYPKKAGEKKLHAEAGMTRQRSKAKHGTQELFKDLTRKISRLEKENILLAKRIANLLPDRSPEYKKNSISIVKDGIIPDGNPANISSRLTFMEKQVLILIATGLTNNEIAEKLERSPHTIITHRRKLLSKLQLKNSAALSHFAVKSGLV